jgi:hypothetical protein
MASGDRKLVTSRPVTQRRPSSVLKPPKTSEDDIRVRAYAIFQTRMRDGLPGNAMSDWLQAERELVKVAVRRGSKARSLGQ